MLEEFQGIDRPAVSIQQQCSVVVLKWVISSGRYKPIAEALAVIRQDKMVVIQAKLSRDGCYSIRSCVCTSISRIHRREDNMTANKYSRPLSSGLSRQ